MKKISTFITITGLLLTLSTMPAFAQNITGNRVYLPKNVASKSGDKTKEPRKDTIINTKTENLKNRASNEITRRITTLTHVISKISAIKRLTESQKNSLTSDIQAEIESLKLLNTKIQADTDIETLRTDVKSIVTSYRIYLLYLPQTQIIIAADALLKTSDTITQLVAKLQTRITEDKNAGKDTSSLEKILADMQTKIEDAKTQANNAINTVSQLKPTDYPGNKPSLQEARTMLHTGLKDLQTVRQDTQKIITDLRKANKNTTGTPSNTTTESEITPTSTTPASASNTQSIEQ